MGKRKLIECLIFYIRSLPCHQLPHYHHLHVIYSKEKCKTRSLHFPKGQDKHALRFSPAALEASGSLSNIYLI